MDNIKYDWSIFTEELEFIRDEKLRDFIQFCLESAPNFFYEMPASTTGKYHPSYSLGVGGLVRHTKAAVKIAVDLLNLQQNAELKERSGDLIISALILHDVHKKESENSIYTAFEHPLLASAFVRKKAIAAHLDLDSPKLYQDVLFMCSMIESHMGQWNTDRQGMVVMPLPETEEAKFVHTCDYLASRKYLEVKF